MRVMVVGSGGREHALVHALRRSPSVDALFAAPGNPGIAEMADVLPVPVDDLPALVEAAADLRVDLTVVGPELPLALGIADRFSDRGLRLFGPSRDAAELEASKVFAKSFCLRHGLPTARAETAASAEEAEAAVARLGGPPIVLKADGLASGKGVVIARDEAAVRQALVGFFGERRFGDAGDRVLVEELLVGEEVSYMVVSDGRSVVPLPTSHDYKRLGDGDSGPNTGGMGAHSPAVLAPEVGRRILTEIVEPTVAALAAEGRPYRGALYVGLMLTADGPRVLEFNCRLGDPETQAILLRADGDLARLLRSAADGEVDPGAVTWRREAVACVVLAAGGYPERPLKGATIDGVERAREHPGTAVYHAGTARDGDRLTVAGGRVLSVCGRGADLRDAVECAYAAADEIRFDGRQIRRDIGADSLRRLSADPGRGGG